MAAIVFTTFAEVQAALQNFVNNNKIPIAGSPHGAMWANPSMGTAEQQYTNFMGQVPNIGVPILQPGSGKDSYIIKALSGPFALGSKTVTRMPAPNGPYLDQATIDAISAWIDAGAKQ
jgi:hypothetical protein